MRHVIGLTVVAAITAIHGNAIAQAQDGQAIRTANEGYYAALSHRDAASLDKMWDRDGKVFNIFGVSKAPMIGWESVKSGYDDLFKRFVELSVELTEPFIRQNGDRAVVIGVETQKVKLSSGESASAQLPATNVFVKRDGRWLMIHHHSSRPRRSSSITRFFSTETSQETVVAL
jgi:uncharacterized protein (TIGR02246 family)